MTSARSSWSWCPCAAPRRTPSAPDGSGRSRDGRIPGRGGLRVVRVKKSSRVSGVGEDRKVEFFKSFESRTTTSIQQTLSGASLFTSSETESALRLGYALTERESEAAS